MVDPQRDVTAYLDDAHAQSLSIERVIETHFHADFLSGHLELAEATGAVISYGTEARRSSRSSRSTTGGASSWARWSSRSVTRRAHAGVDLDRGVGAGERHHAVGAPTGDAPFVGDVGRPDLLTLVGYTADELARQLYQSLHDQLLTPPDSTQVFPAHGAGSACGKSMSDAVSSTIGEQRRWNYALQPMSRTRSSRS